MKSQSTSILAAIVFLAITTLVSCDCGYLGPYEEESRTYGISNFDRVDMGSAFRVTVQAGNLFSVEARGNRADMEDLELYTRNGTLYANYRDHWRNRRYDLFITITMPTVRSLTFSGASRSTIRGFTNLRELDMTLSGASRSTADFDVERLILTLSGASNLELNGIGGIVRGKFSGASDVAAFNFAVSEAELDLSGASRGRVQVSKLLDVTASGASSVRYRGNPMLRTRLSSNSTVRED